jgi:hypothetical protein
LVDRGNLHRIGDNDERMLLVGARRENIADMGGTFCFDCYRVRVDSR